MDIRQKRMLWTGGLVLLAGAAIWQIRVQHGPKHVLIISSEKDLDDDNKAFRTTDTSFDSEERFQRWMAWLAKRPPCMVLTRNKNKADFLVHIDVIRYNPVRGHGPGDELWGDAKLSVVKSNGDVISNESFWQGTGMYRGSGDDISNQPLKRAWEILCSSPPPL